MVVIDPQMLESIGLTPGEAKVYLALLKLGMNTTGPIAKESGVSVSKIYYILEKLMKKGLVSTALKERAKHFQAVEPSRIKEYLAEKEEHVRQEQKSLASMLPLLNAIHADARAATSTSMFTGLRAIRNFFESILDDLEKGESYRVIGAGYGETLGGREFFSGFHRRRARLGIKLLMLADYDTKPRDLVKSTHLEASIRYIPYELITRMEIITYGRKTFFVIWSHNPVGFLIEDEEVAKSFYDYFEGLWKIAPAFEEKNVKEGKRKN